MDILTIHLDDPPKGVVWFDTHAELQCHSCFAGDLRPTHRPDGLYLGCDVCQEVTRYNSIHQCCPKCHHPVVVTAMGTATKAMWSPAGDGNMPTSCSCGSCGWTGDPHPETVRR